VRTAPGVGTGLRPCATHDLLTTHDLLCVKFTWDFKVQDVQSLQDVTAALKVASLSEKFKYMNNLSQQVQDL
jgi:hypothetical protein